MAKRTAADLEAEAKKFAEEHPDDMEGSQALARKLIAEADRMKGNTTMAKRAISRLLIERFAGDRPGRQG